MSHEEGQSELSSAVLFLCLIVIMISAALSIVMIELIEKGWISETYAIPSPSYSYRVPDYIGTWSGRR